MFFFGIVGTLVKTLIHWFCGRDMLEGRYMYMAVLCGQISSIVESVIQTP